MLTRKDDGELFEAPANWTFDPHSQKERTTRAAAEQRVEVLTPRDILIIEQLRRWRAKPPDRRPTWRQLLQLINYVARKAGVVLSVGRGVGVITKRIAETAQERLDKGKRRATCQESKCGRDPGAPCYGRPWVDTRTWYRLGVVERYRRTLDQRAAIYAVSRRGRGRCDLLPDHLPITQTQRGKGCGRETAYIAAPSPRRVRRDVAGPGSRRWRGHSGSGWREVVPKRAAARPAPPLTDGAPTSPGGPRAGPCP